MIGLRQHMRDLALPARLGCPELEPPDPALFAEICRVNLALRSAPPIIGASCEYARLKPGVSITACYSVNFVDGVQQVVTLKRYMADKVTGIVDDYRPPTAVQKNPRLSPFTVLADHRTCLWAFPEDRKLPGLGRALDARWTSKFLNREEVFGNERVRTHLSQAAVLRYKPERRSVLRWDLGLSCSAADERQTLAARVSPQAAMGRSIHRRRRLGDGVVGIGPRLICSLDRVGLLVEEWLDGTSTDPDDFGVVQEVATLLARLHCLPLLDVGSISMRQPVAEPWHVPLGVENATRRIAKLREWCGDILAGAHEKRTWVHGDIHPDQVLRGDTPRLLDWDELDVGTPATDLGSWIADHLAATCDLRFDEAAHELIGPYVQAGGPELSRATLRGATALGLLDRAMSSLRRLEEGAMEKAERLTERALRLGPGGDEA